MGYHLDVTLKFLEEIIDTSPINWKKLIQHVESGDGNKEQLRLVFTAITKALKDKQNLSLEFIEYLERVTDRLSKQGNDISLDKAFTNNSFARSTKNQPGLFGGNLPETITMVFKEMVDGTGKDSAIEYVAATTKCSASKVRKDISFYSKDFLAELLVKKQFNNEIFTSKEISVINELLDPNFSTQ